MRMSKRMVISISDICSAGCYYCDFPKLQKHAHVASTENIDKAIKIINTEYDLNTNNFQDFLFRLEGGEPGEIPEDVLEYWYSKCKIPKYTLLSQGEFFRKGYHIKFEHKFDNIMYHVLSGSYKHIEQDIPDYGIKDYLTVIGNKNFDIVESAIRRYPDKTWHLSPETICKSTKVIIDSNLAGKIIGLIEKYPQVNASHVLEQMERLPTINNDKRVMCANDYSKPYFDIKNMLLKRCIASFTNSSSIKLTQKSFHDLLLNKKKLFPTTDEMCKNCEIKEIYKDYFKEYSIKEVQKIIRKVNE